MSCKRICSVFLIILLLFSPFISVWAKSSKGTKKSACSQAGYYCLKVKRGQSWQSLFPDARERGIVMRINHRNGGIWPGLVLKVPEDLSNGDLLDYSPLPHLIEPPNERLLVFDPAKHAFGAYDESGELVRWGPATGGNDWCEDIDQSCRTKAGSFRVYSLGSSNCKSSKFPLPDGGAPMPYCMFFNGGQAFHGSPGGVIRDNVSHGCVRLFVEDAEWMRYDFVEPPMSSNDYQGTKVIVLPYSSPTASMSKRFYLDATTAVSISSSGQLVVHALR